MHTVRMVGSDLAPRNIDIATRRTDADVDDNRRASCFRDHAPQIGKLLAFCVSRADDEDAPHRKISKRAAALIVQTPKISEACGPGSFSALPGKHHVHRPHHSPHLLAFLMREL